MGIGRFGYYFLKLSKIVDIMSDCEYENQDTQELNDLDSLSLFTESDDSGDELSDGFGCKIEENKDDDEDDVDDDNEDEDDDDEDDEEIKKDSSNTRTQRTPTNLSNQYKYDITKNKLSNILSNINFYKKIGKLAIDSYFYKYGLIRHQLESFNAFMSRYVPNIIKEHNPFIIKVNKGQYIHTFKNITIEPPHIIEEMVGLIHRTFPDEIRNRGLTYESNVKVDIDCWYRPNGCICKLKIGDCGKCKCHMLKSIKGKTIFKLPIMVGSMYCNLYKSGLPNKVNTHGGFFIINGGDKVILPQETYVWNVPITKVIKRKNKYMFKCEVRSKYHYKIRSTATLRVMLKKSKNGEVPLIYVRIPHIKVDLPLRDIFTLFDISNEQLMIDIIVHGAQMDKQLIYYITELMKSQENTKSKNELLTYIGRYGLGNDQKNKLEYIKHLVYTEFLPHLGFTKDIETIYKKLMFLGIMVKKILLMYHNVQLKKYKQNTHFVRTDLEDFRYKRLYTPGYLLALALRFHHQQNMKKLKNNLEKELNIKDHICNIADRINSSIISKAMCRHLATGDWSLDKKSNTLSGYAQMLDRSSNIATYAHLRRFNHPIPKEGKMIEPRQLHPSHYGIICICETPEGEPCGLVKNLAMLSHLSIGTPFKTIKKIIYLISDQQLFSSNWSIPPDNTNTTIFINSTPIGTTKKPIEFLKLMRLYRRQDYIAFDSDIYTLKNTYFNQIHIDVDVGRLVRPVFVLSNIYKINDILPFCNAYNIWELFMSEGIIEYIGKNEEYECLIAHSFEQLKDNKQFTYCDIHPSIIFGTCASLIPFPEHNQAPRNIYQTCMQKQAIGFPFHNEADKMYTKAHKLWYFQEPLTATMQSKMYGFDKTPSGQNAIVAIMSGVYNQEDSLLFNKRFIDLGGFRSSAFKVHKTTEKKNGNDVEVFEKPNIDKVFRLQYGNYDKLGSDGIISSGEHVQENDVIIGKTIKINNLKSVKTNQYSLQDIKKDRSILCKQNEEGIVHKVLRSNNNENKNQTYKIQIRSMMVPERGDKFSSRHGQKGTIGRVVPPEDMPFTQDGLTPDIIINPHAIPSRMTIGQLKESGISLLAAFHGKIANGTAFEKIPLTDIQNELVKAGFNRNGEHVMTNGITGNTFKSTICMGIVNYQKLKHMVKNKIHARSTGTKQFLSRQPNEGRSKNGGLRFGEMERDTSISHGVSNIIRDRLLLQSDRYDVPFCTKCGNLAQINNIKESTELWQDRVDFIQFCKVCETGKYVKNTVIPYAAKLMMQEIGAMNIHTKVRLKKNYFNNK